MCWNEPVSWATLIIGTLLNIFNIYYFRDKQVTAISLAIQWVLLMQFFEALAWRDQECGNLNRFATKGALIANVTQPIVACLLLIFVSPASNSCKAAAAILTLLYTAYIIYELRGGIGKYNCLRPATACHHLDLAWWKDISALPYMIALFGVIILLVRPFSLALMLGGYVALALLLSVHFYHCGAGSIWCWFVAALPLVLTLKYGR